METTEGLTLRLSRKACSVAAKNGWTAEAIQGTFDTPKAIYASKTHEGQWRIAGTEIVIVGVPMDDTTFFGITMFRNGSKAPVKEEKA
jgi:hypothetical protein